MANKFKVIKIEDDYKILYISSKPPVIEAKVIFDRDHISQKLIFILMEITHKHGFGCSQPTFGDEQDSNMTFFIGTVLPSSRSLKTYLERIHACLKDVDIFSKEFIKQLDFSRLDLSMFSDLNKDFEIFPEQLAALRDQLYNGSWTDFKKAMDLEGREDMAEMAIRCMNFEENNNKDIGLVGHKLSYILDVLAENSFSEVETN